jgi:phenylacetate-CoA ligase
MKDLDESQWWPIEKIVELQNQRLQHLIASVYENVPYYRRIFDDRSLNPTDIKSGTDLHKLPLLNKALVRQNFNDLLAKGYPSKRMVYLSTSGSMAEPLALYRSRDGLYNPGYAAAQRSYGWAGYEIGEKCLLFGITRPHLSAWGQRRERATAFFERVMFFNVLEITPENIARLVKRMQSYKPRFIRGYPSAIYVMARFIEREGGPKIEPEAVITTAEQVYDYQRELFSKVFGCETFSFYSAIEAPSIAGECTEHSGLHISAENTIIEIVDDGGSVVPAGVEGKVLVTCLHDHAMPIIRYEIGDRGALSDAACPCGRGLPLLGNLSGRENDTLITRDGKRVPGTGLPRKFFAFWGVIEYLIVQETYDKIMVTLALDRQYPQQHIEGLKAETNNQYHAILGDDVEIAIEFVDHIPLTRAGKRIGVISKVVEQNHQKSGT